ncbi:MAG: hypothetical protein ACI9KI_000055, partial [Patiriisocius sp.]
HTVLKLAINIKIKKILGNLFSRTFPASFQNNPMKQADICLANEVCSSAEGHCATLFGLGLLASLLLNRKVAKQLRKPTFLKI